MVKINKFTETKCFLHNDEQFIGEINSYLELTDVRIQIMEQKLEGYYIYWHAQKRVIPIDSRGNLCEWPKGFYDLYDKQLEKLIFGVK